MTELTAALPRRSMLQFLCGALGSMALPVRAETSDTEQRLLYVQPLGSELPTSSVAVVSRALEAFYRVTVVELEPKPLPRRAYYPPRRRYRAERLLEFLDEMAPPDAYRILGLTAVDISTTKGAYADWGILGLATIDGKACVLSAFRCKRGAKDKAQVEARLGKTAVHEIGHTLGLEHCPALACIMEDARGTVATTDREYDLCAACRQELAALGREARGDVKPPWPRPTAG